MIRLLSPVNHKGQIYESGIVCFEREYEEILVKTGNATFEIGQRKQTTQVEQNEEDSIKSIENQTTNQKSRASRKASEKE